MAVVVQSPLEDIHTWSRTQLDGENTRIGRADGRREIAQLVFGGVTSRVSRAYRAAAAAHSYCRRSEYQCPLPEFVRAGFVGRYVHRSLALHGKYCQPPSGRRRPPVRARGRQDAHFLVWHDYFRRKQRSRRKTKHRTNAIISILEGGGASQTDGCISVSISGKRPLMHQRGGFTTLREATVHAMKDELRPFQRVGMNLSERNGTAQPLIRR